MKFLCINAYNICLASYLGYSDLFINIHLLGIVH